MKQFSQATLDFLFEVWSRNDRVWYHENKETGRIVLQEPFIDLVRALQPTMLAIDPRMDVSEKRIARVYRDARIVGNGPFFRDHIWCTFSRGRDVYHGYPGFYFEVSTRGFGYGLGYYVPAKESVDAVREMILAEDPAFVKAFKANKRQKVYTFEGESYKRNHYPEAPEAYWEWLNRKGFVWTVESDDTELLFSDRLADTVAADFKKIAPIYDFLIKAESSWRE